MKNKLNFYTKLFSSILDSCCSYIVIIENSDIKLISSNGNKPFDLDTVRLLINNFDSTKKSFSVLKVKDFKTTIKNENFSSKNLNSIGYLPLFDKNKITIGYIITGFNKPFSFIKSQEKTLSLLSEKIAEKLQKNKSTTTKDLKYSGSTDFELHLTKEILKKTFKFSNDVFCIINKDQKFEFVSNSSLNVWGYSPEEMIDTHFKNYIVEEDSLEKDNKLKNNAAISLFENRYITKSGKIKWLDWNVIYVTEDKTIFAIARDVTEKKELENLLEKANSLARIGNWDVDLIKQTVYWSEITREIHEVKSSFVPALATGLKFYKEGTGRELIKQRIKEAIELGKPWDEELEIVTAKNNIRWIRTIGEPEFVDGKCVKIYGSFQDIDDFKKNEAAIKKSEEKQKIILQSLLDYVIVLNANGEIQYVNDVFSGVPEVEVIGSSFLLWLHEEDQLEVKKAIDTTLSSGIFSQIQIRAIGPDKKMTWFDTKIVCMQNVPSRQVPLVATDITEHKKNELLLQDSNNKYKYLFDNNPSPLFIFDFESLEIIDCNIEALMLYGYSREEFLQLTIKDIRPEEDIALILETTANESAYGEIHKKVWRHLKKNGELMFVEITGHLLDYNDRRSSLVLVNDITAKIELEKKQLEYVQFVETIIENLPIGIAVNKIDDGSVTLMNQQFSEIYGWPKQDLTDVATFFEKMYPDVDYREKIVNQVMRNLSSKDPEKMNWEGITITTQDGTKKIVNAKNIPIYDQKLMISTVVDVTEKYAIQRNLRQSNERYHYVSLATSDALWDWDFENNLISRAEGFKTIFGFDMEELNSTNTKWENYVHPDDRYSATKSMHDKVNGSENYWKHDYRIIKPNGEVAFVQDSGYIIRGENNSVIRIIGALQDITERKKEEEKLSKAANALQKALNDTNKIMDSSLDLICVVNEEGYFVKVSAASEAILGYKPAELIGKPFINYVYTKDNEKTLLTANVVMSGTSIKHFENRYIRKDGSLVSLEWAARWDERDKLRYGVARDITERKTYEEQLVKLNKDLNKQKAELITSNKELEQFAYVASHDLQEPLRMVTSFLTLLEKKYVDVLDENGLKYINFAVEGAKSMRQIILDILEFSRIDNNEENYEFIDLKDIIKDISLLQGKLIKEKKAKIIFDNLPILYSIRHYLSQLFQNIISNALKYSKEEVPLEILISSEEHNTYYEIAITDNGIGIEREYYEKIFIIFQRLHSKEKYLGNGIGLAIAKKIVNKLNGKIWVQSEVGIGSTFYINIPKKKYD